MTIDPVQTELANVQTSEKQANIVMQCVLDGDTARLQDCFTKDEDRELLESQLNSTDEQGRLPIEIACTEGNLQMLRLLLEKGSSDPNTRNPNTGKTPLDMACILGRDDMVKEFLEKGADGESATKRGYTALHHASAWGRIACLKLLVQFGCSLQVRTSNGENPREVALRYGHDACAHYLNWSEARRALLAVIREIRDNTEDVQKVQGRLTKDERMTAINACTEKQEWIENGSDSLTVDDFNKQRQILMDLLEPLLIKMSEPPPEKSHRR